MLLLHRFVFSGGRDGESEQRRGRHRGPLARLLALRKRLQDGQEESRVGRLLVDRVVIRVVVVVVILLLLIKQQMSWTFV